jgi:hypothetical protein
VISALFLIALCFGICLLATPFLALLWLLSKWTGWVNGMVNGSDKGNDSKEIIKLLAKLIAK